MSKKIAFLYCTGTAYTISMFGTALAQSVATGRWYWGDDVINPGADPQMGYTAGLNGKLYPWNGEVFQDPFPYMLDLDIWEPQRIAYADSSVTFLVGDTLVGGMGASINDGVTKVLARINALAPGTPFAIGGYSQGAAVMSQIYNELRTGSLTSRYPEFLGGVMFGNPRRQVNHRGEIGGTWSGAWDVPGSTTGGHGSFPAAGPWARLTGCDGTEWIEFAAPNDIITATGDSDTGLKWTQGNDALLGLLSSQYAGPILLEAVVDTLFPWLNFDQTITAISTAFAVAEEKNYLIDPTGTVGSYSGAGHVIYPHLPPPNASGVIPTVSQEVTTTFTLGGASTSTLGTPVYATRVRRGKVPATFATTEYEMTQTYLKAPPDTDTCYQLALKWLEAKAAEYVTAPILLPPTRATGWSTTLVPPSP